MTTNSFEVFTPDKKFHLTNNRVIYGLFILGVLLFFIEDVLLDKDENSVIGKTGMVIWIACMTIGGILSLYSTIKYKPLRGILEGRIIFETDKIVIHGDDYKIADLQKISFPEYNDYVGEGDVWDRSNRYNFNWKLSQGVDNAIALHFERGKVMIFNFLLVREYQLRDIQEQLIAYEKAGKLDMLELLDILGIENQDEITNFTKAINSGAVD